MFTNVHFEPNDPILDMIASINGNTTTIKKYSDGIYITGHWDFEHIISEEVEVYPDLGDIPTYGVCDSPEQLMDKFGSQLDAMNEGVVISLVPIKREAQEEVGGWRYHKWGEYIGTQNPIHEYLYDDKHIDLVYTFHIYKIKNNISSQIEFSLPNYYKK